MNNNKIKSESLGKVKKLAYIVTLDNMLKSYDELNKQDEDVIVKCGRSVSDLTDAICMKLTNLVNSGWTISTVRTTLNGSHTKRLQPRPSRESKDCSALWS